METHIEVLFDKVVSQAAYLLVTGDWNMTTSIGTCDEFLSCLMETPGPGRAFNNSQGGKGRGIFLEWVKKKEGDAENIFILMKNSRLLQANGVPINIEDKYAEKKPLPPPFQVKGYAQIMARR